MACSSGAAVAGAKDLGRRASNGFQGPPLTLMIDSYIFSTPMSRKRVFIRPSFFFPSGREAGIGTVSRRQTVVPCISVNSEDAALVFGDEAARTVSDTSVRVHDKLTTKQYRPSTRDVAGCP